MATYTKKLKTLAVHLMLDSEVVNIADTASDDMATRALNEFKKYGTMHYETENSGGQKITNAIPYHAVQYIEVTETDGSISKDDPYGCEEPDKGYTIVYGYGGEPIKSGVKVGDTLTFGDFSCQEGSAGTYITINGVDVDSGHCHFSDYSFTFTEEMVSGVTDGIVIATCGPCE